MYTVGCFPMTKYFPEPLKPTSQSRPIKRLTWKKIEPTDRKALDRISKNPSSLSPIQPRVTWAGSQGSLVRSLLTNTRIPRIRFRFRSFTGKKSCGSNVRLYSSGLPATSFSCIRTIELVGCSSALKTTLKQWLWCFDATPPETVA